MIKYLYPIRRGSNDYYFGHADQNETIIENLCSHKCQHENSIHASDCFRERLLNNKAIKVVIQPRKCCHPKCSNATTEALNYGYDFQFPLCEDHQDKASVRKVCGFGFPLILRDKQ